MSLLLMTIQDFPRLHSPQYLLGSTFVDWGDQSLVPNIGEDARAKDDVKEF